MRRILTDYGFIGYPLRKDYPLIGYLESRFDDIINSVIFEMVSLSQKLRFYIFINPWA